MPSVRRVLVVDPQGDAAELDWARRALSGRELLDQGTRQPAALLALISEHDRNLRWYVGTAAVWSTVTPVVLPGHDEAAPWTVDRRVRRAPDEAARRRVLEQAAARTERLLRRAFEQAGMPPDLVREASLSLEWKRTGYRAGVDLATRYDRPEPCRLPRWHARVRWPFLIRGPLFVGAADTEAWASLPQSDRRNAARWIAGKGGSTEVTSGRATTAALTTLDNPTYLG